MIVAVIPSVMVMMITSMIMTIMTMNIFIPDMIIVLIAVLTKNQERKEQGNKGRPGVQNKTINNNNMNNK